MSNNVAKNTVFLYFRMILILLVGLYTSRVVLKVLGEDDFGIYGVVGGVVSLFTVLTGSLSASISRFLTYELGRGDGRRLRTIFSTAVIIQAGISLVIAVLVETVGLWFVRSQMTIPPERTAAAVWVLHFSLVTFIVNLVSVPYHATIVAHEKMSAFAFISILEALCKLAVAALISAAPMDRLVFYAILMCGVSIIVRFAYGYYCSRHFSECRGGMSFDAGLLKDMTGFAGWNFIGASSAILRDHGGNILMNIFGNTAVNAARSIATQVNGAVNGFVVNFMTALNPQITKSYASGDNPYMMKLIYKGARFSFYLLLALSLPILFNTEYILDLWLDDVPEHTAAFVQLVLVFALSETVSGPLVTAALATGNIKKYQLIVGGLQMLNVPVSYVCLKFGAPPESVLVVAIVLSVACFAARMFILKKLIGLDSGLFMKKVYLNVVTVAILSCVFPFMFEFWKEYSFAHFVISSAVCLAGTAAAVWFAGMGRDERKYFIGFLRDKAGKYRKK